MKTFYSVELAVIRQDFSYISYRAVYSTLSKKNVLQYFEWMQEYLNCHCLLRIKDNDGNVISEVVEMNCPDGEYIIPPEKVISSQEELAA